MCTVFMQRQVLDGRTSILEKIVMLISTIVGLLILRNKNILGQSAGCHDSLIECLPVVFLVNNSLSSRYLSATAG